MSNDGENNDYLRKLIKKRDATARRIVRIANHLQDAVEENATDMAVDAARIDRDDLDKCFVAFEDVQDNIEEEVSGDELEVHEAERVRIETIVRATKVSAANFLRKSSPANDTGNASAATHLVPTKIKRPEITVPKFSGEVKRWSEFKNVFTSLVIDEKLYSDVERMIYLKQAVQGKAAEVIANFEISRENFQRAWEKLRKRYENRRAVISNYLEALCHLPHAKAETEVAPLLDAATDAIESLNSVGVKDGWQLMLCHLVATKLDSETRKQWELSIVGEEEYPTYSRLERFLQQRVRVFESIGTATGNRNSVTSSKKEKIDKTSNEKSRVLLTKETPTQKVSNTPNSAVSTRLCFDCGAANHSLFECKAFLNKSIEEKTQVIQRRGLCFNCFNRGHRVADCRGRKCEKCGRRHNVLLHREEAVAVVNHGDSIPSKPAVENVEKTNENSTTSAKNFLIRPAATYICLPAALVYVFGKDGRRFVTRAFLDSASGVNVVSERLAKKLRCKIEESNVVISTLMPGQLAVAHSCVVNIKSRINSFQLKLSCQIAPSIAEEFVSFDQETMDKKELVDYALADNPHVNAGKVDLLIGAEYFEELMLAGKIKVGEKAYLRETEFGWVFIGLAQKRNNFENSNLCYLTIEKNFQRFWNLDEIFEVRDSWTDEERKVDEEFEKSFNRSADGRFVLKLPKKLPIEVLGESRNIAFRRLLALEKRLNKVPEILQEYRSFLKEYENLGHMTKIPCREALVYLPHHAVFKEESTTTKTRVVFNAASSTSSGYSLNDFLAKGPVIQQDLFVILMRFRSKRVAFTADIEKMYRQIMINDDDRKLQCILWRNAESNAIETFRLNTVTYGTKPASYLATKCLSKLAEIYAEQYEISSKIVKTDFYMDDLLSGADSIDEAQKLIREIRKILQSAGFNLRKFSSSSSEVLNELADDLIVQSRTFEDLETISVLGVKWSGSDKDQFRFFNHLSLANENKNMTKRLFLSQVFRIYDPLGLLAPIVISLKFMLQELWRCKIDWDTLVPNEILERFRKICRELEILPSLTVDRWVGFTIDSEIHVFCDASSKGYGAAAYVRTVQSNGIVIVNLLSAKSRVAPLNVVSIPRLELCAALLGARLFKKIKISLCLPETMRISAWTDSTVVLAWLCFESGNCKTFVANRVTKVRAILQSEFWFHVTSDNNAADIISRGMESEFERLKEFWQGPEFLRANIEISYPDVELDPLALQEMKSKVKSCMTIEKTSLLFERFSCYENLISFVAYIMRFSKTLREERHEMLELSPFERVRAHQILIRKVQSNVMSKILALDSFVDEDGIWRLRNRIGKAELTYESKYPIIIPKCRFLLLLVRYWHAKYFHAGISFLKNFIRTSYHVLADLNRMVRGVIYGCVHCRRYLANLTYDPPVGELPPYRVTVSQAFCRVGVDFAGPFRTRAVGPGGNRGKILFKSYVCIFVCMVTRAVHIEIVEDLSTKAFLDCFSRFVARRGLCETIFSDHGTNFVGANRELRAAFLFLKKNRSEFVSHCAKNGVQWKFIPERAPHFGGLWEAAVKSFKYHYKRVVGEQILSFAELNTLSCRIEAVLNARPICTSSDSVSTVITPAHLCIGKNLLTIPPICGEVVKGAARVRYSMVQTMFERFWHVWRQEYLIALRHCYFKKVGAREAKIDDIVLLKDENTPPASWPMGRITRCLPGTDGVCRVVEVLVKGKILRRPVVKLVPLLPE